MKGNLYFQNIKTIKKSVRNDENLLFLTSMKQIKFASKNTILCWIKNLLGIAGISKNLFKLH